MSALDEFFNNPYNWALGANITVGEDKLHYTKMAWVGDDEIPFEEAKAELAALRSRVHELEVVYRLAIDECNKATHERDLARHSLNECRRERDQRTARIIELEAGMEEAREVMRNVMDSERRTNFLVDVNMWLVKHPQEPKCS